MQRGTSFLNVLRDLCGDFSHKIIMGDFNGDLTSNCDDANFIKRLSEELSLQIVPHGPTHHVNASHTWIDLILTDDNDTIMGHDNQLLPSFGKHAIIDVTIDISLPEPCKDTYSYRDVNSICPQMLNDLLAKCDWSAAESIEADLEGAVKLLNSNLDKALNTLAPLKMVHPPKKLAPWIGPELRELIDKRDATHRRYKRTGRVAFLGEFLELDNEVDTRIEQERNNYLHKHLSDALANGKNIWREMKRLGLLPRSFEGGELHGFTPDELNEHFAGVSVSPLENIEDAMDAILASSEDGFSFKPVTFNDVVLAISHFSSQARGVDGIPQRLIVNALPAIGDHLVSLFNSSFALGIFPSTWKQAQLIALKKSNLPSSPSEFRPIALLCFLSKVLEKLAHDQIVEHLTINKILDPLQTGFRKHHSTQTALLKLTEDVRHAVDKKKVTLLLLFDFSKAFDTISPSKLLRKLCTMGFSRMSLLWIKSYLQGRTQRVTTSNSCSGWMETNLGVPQGSVLGPLLFCLYVNDLQDVLKGHNISHIFYADDLQIYLHVNKNEIHEGIERLSRVAKLVANWAEGSGLRLNAGKTKAIILGSRRNVNTIDEMGLPGIEVGTGVFVPFSNEVVSLGVTLDSKLTWRPHVNQVTKKVNRILYGLRFIRSCTSQDLRKKLVESLVQPHLDYCAAVCLDAPLEQTIRLQRLSNSCVRYIFGVRRDQHISPYRKRLEWLRTDSRRNYFIAILMYKIIRMREPSYLADLFSKCESRRSCRGEKPELDIPKVRTETGLKSFRVTGARLWNSLPSSVRHVPSLQGFKRALRKHLLDLEP